MCGFGCTGSSGLVLYTDDFCHFYNYWPLYGKRCIFLSGLRSSGWKETERRYLALLLAVISIFILAFAGNLMQFFVGADYRGRREILKNWGSHLCGDWDAVSLVWLFPGHKQPHISLILTVISLSTRVALSYALAPHTAFGVVAIWCSIPIGWFLADIVGYGFYCRNKKWWNPKSDGRNQQRKWYIREVNCAWIWCRTLCKSIGEEIITQTERLCNAIWGNRKKSYYMNLQPTHDNIKV